MKRLLRRGSLSAVVALVVLPAAAHAALTPTVSVTSVTSGCGPKGVLALPSTGGGLPAGTYKYKVEATVAGADTTPCEEFTTGSAAANAAFLVQWESTPGATQYKIFRNDQLVRTLAVPTAASATGACGPAPAPADPVSRCFIVDNAGNAAAATAPGALPTASTAAGSSPDINISQAFDYAGVATDSSDDPTPNGSTTTDPKSASLKTNVLHFPAGLAANPGAAGTCSLAQLLGDVNVHGSADTAEDKCPRSSQVGTVLARIETQNGSPATTQPTPTVGDIYLGAKLGSETARLYVVLRPACSSGSFVAPSSATCQAAGIPNGAEVEKSFLSAKATLRKDGTFGIDNETTNISDGTDKELEPVSRIDLTASGARAGSVPIQVQSIRQTLFGSADQGTADKTDDKAFTALPTSCAAKTFRTEASSYLDPTNVAASAAMQATNCDALAFAPKLTLAVDATGQAQQNGHPQVTANITQAVGEAATKKTVVTLPEGLGTNTLILGNACTQAQVTAETCPATSKIGTATATTPLLPGTFTGDVFLSLPPGGAALPNLEVFLKGPADIHITGNTAFDSTNTRLVNVFDNLPEVPLNTFKLVIDGGPNGLLNNSRNLCSGLGTANIVSNAYSGKNTTADVPTALTGQGTCAYDTPYYPVGAKPAKPKFSVKVSGVRKKRPKVSMTLKRGKANKVSNLRKSTVTLPKGLKFTKKGKKRTVVKVNGKKVKTFKAKGRKLTITSKSTTKKITVSTKRGALKETRKVRRGGKKKKLTFKASVKVQKPKTYKITKKVKPKS